MSAGQVAALYAVWVIAVVSPGPDLVVVLQRSLSGRRQGVATAVGVVTGIMIWLAAAVAGLAALVRVYPALMTVLQVAGGLLLAGVGALGLRSWWRARAATIQDTGSARSTDAAEQGSRPGLHRAGPEGRRLPGGDFARGLATNLANPKAVVFFGAVLTPFLRGEVATGPLVLVSAGMVVIALAWFTGLAWAASHAGVRRRLDRALPWVDPVAGALFVAVGVAFVIGATPLLAGD